MEKKVHQKNPNNDKYKKAEKAATDNKVNQKNQYSHEHQGGYAEFLLKVSLNFSKIFESKWYS